MGMTSHLCIPPLLRAFLLQCEWKIPLSWLELDELNNLPYFTQMWWNKLSWSIDNAGVSSDSTCTLCHSKEREVYLVLKYVVNCGILSE